jgi:hypothetical protein
MKENHDLSRWGRTLAVYAGSFIIKMANFVPVEAWPSGEFAGKPFSGIGFGLFSSYSWKITIAHHYKVKHW